MVGVPRSGGCQLCRKRKVKCDQARPGCTNCIKYGVDCPGYERSFKFIAGKHHVRKKGERHSTLTSPLSSSSSSVNPSLGQSSIIVPVSRAVFQPCPLILSPAPVRGPLIATLLDKVRPSLSNRDFMGFFSWIQLDRLGQKVTLDGAIYALILHVSGKEAADEQALAHSRSIYIQALRALQSALQHPIEWKSSDTLCSAILLCIFEVLSK